MIHFLVNNDYQLLDARQHLAALRGRGLQASLIEVPHTLNLSDRGVGFAGVQRLASPLAGRRWLGAWPRYFAAAREVAARLRPGPGDVLFLYTEYELLNHLIAQRFKRAGARVYLVEDGGVATYIPFSLPGDEPLTPKERVIALMTRSLPGLGRTQFHKVNGVVFPWLADRWLDGVCVYRPLRIVRDIPVHVLRREGAAPAQPLPGRVVFLNEPLYDHYQTPEQYLRGLDLILQALGRGFGEVLFKFHPRETPQWQQRIRALLAGQHAGVRIIENRQPIEALLAEQRPQALASYFCAALLNLGDSAIEPLFLYHLLPELAGQKLCRQITALLQGWDYRFAADWGEVRSGYRSGIASQACAHGTTLAELAARP